MCLGEVRLGLEGAVEVDDGRGRVSTGHASGVLVVVGEGVGRSELDRPAVVGDGQRPLLAPVVGVASVVEGLGDSGAQSGRAGVVGDGHLIVFAVG